MKLRLPNISTTVYKLQGFIITMALLAAKIFGYIDIGWIWVFGAYWIPLALFLTFVVLAAIGVLAVALVAVLLDKAGLI